MTHLETLVLEDRDEAVFIAIDSGVSHVARDELRAWATSEVSEAGGARGVDLDAVLTLEGLLIAASTGVVGNAAWSVFPAAAHWLSQRVRSADILTLEDVAKRMRGCLRMLGAVPDDFVMAELRQDRDGLWLGEFHHGSTRYRITADTSGRILRARRDEKAA